MSGNSTSTKMPELIVFVRALIAGFVLAESFLIAYFGGSGLLIYTNQLSPIGLGLFLVIIFFVVLWYSIARGIKNNIFRLVRSQRYDLLLASILGSFATYVISPKTQEFHNLIAENPLWTLLISCFMLIMISSSLIRAILPKRENPVQMYFLTDAEILDEREDLLGNKKQSVQFAEMVLASGSSSALVYGIDAPWGAGKTSFINLASKHWRASASNEVIIFRFEPLRYASDPDLAERFIRDLSAQIQHQVFVPEFPSAVTRYSRLLKGKTDFSFLGFKFTLEPSTDTVDELLQDIDDVLKRLRRRLIVVIDDLDRLDIKAINNVLFTVQRTFRLTQATYILCYDTEILVSNKDQGTQARHFLEKFINIKLSLFVDSSTLVKFLRSEWNEGQNEYQSIPSETMLKLASVLSELANILESKEASLYISLIGDMRKLKRFINAVLMLQIEKTDLARTDFNRRDLINLVLLHLHYPGIFRRIYSEETAGRSGIFSIKYIREAGNRGYANDMRFTTFDTSGDDIARFLLNQLFSKELVNLDSFDEVDESERASRACFNTAPNRNLEKYLDLIVRFTIPEPRATFKLYQEAVAAVEAGRSIQDVLKGSEFSLKNGDVAHDRFWQIIVGRSHDFRERSASDSIDTLVDLLPTYNTVGIEDRDLRSRSIYNLIRLLDRAGWGRTASQRMANTPEVIVEIAHHIFGEKKYLGRSLIDRLAHENRGVLGLYDLLLFRLQCSADRQGQIYNVHNALVLYEDPGEQTSRLVQDLAIQGMRTISQRIFALFRTRYIDATVNIFEDIESTSDAEFLGGASEFNILEAESRKTQRTLQEWISASRSMKKSFIVYQLANVIAGTGSGVGTGYYDLSGKGDSGEISNYMNAYLFDFCFNPDIDLKNGEYFLDHCLQNLISPIWSESDNDGYVPTLQGIVGGLNEDHLKKYWVQHGAAIKSFDILSSNKKVFTLNYTASYDIDLPRVFEILDQLSSITSHQ